MTKAEALSELIAERNEILAEITRREKMPMYIKARFSNALEARLAGINRQIEKANEKSESQQPERLKRLDSELCIERSKDFDYVFAVRGEHRFKVAIFRNGGNGFFATCKVGGQVHRYSGELPSYAFSRLIKSLEWIVSRLDYEKNVATSKIAEARKQFEYQI